MKSIIKKITFIALLCIYLSVFNCKIYAESTNVYVDETIQSFVFDLDKDYQVITFIDNSGDQTLLTVTSNLDGEKQITLSNAYILLSYKIYISNNIITSAYDEYYYTNYYTVVSDTLTINSNTKATYSVNCYKFLMHSVFNLTADISSGSLVISL